MNTFILFWNPAISSWKLEDNQRYIKEQGPYGLNWSVWEHGKACDGDRFFMVRCGEGNTGICTSGRFDSAPYAGKDWSGKDREVYYVDLFINVMIDPEHCPILTTAALQKEIPEFDWTGGHSGRILDAASAEKLEQLWDDFLQQNDEMFQRRAFNYGPAYVEDGDDDVEDEEDGRHYAVVKVLDNGEITIESFVSGRSKMVRARTLADAKSLAYDMLAKNGIDKKNVIFYYDGIPTKMQKLYGKALDIASSKHLGQTDKAGMPYFGHPARVSGRCESAAAKIVALLHDVVEDTDVTIADLKKAGFPPSVINGVLSVTRQDGESYEEFVARAKKDPVGREVKTADLEDNMDIRRLRELNDYDVERLRKYQKAWWFLKA